MKYSKKKVTIIIRGKVKTYNADAQGNVQLVRQERTKDVFGDVVRHIELFSYSRTGVHDFFPYKDFKHFVETTKPWLPKTARKPQPKLQGIDHAKYPSDLWYHVLRQLIKKYNFDIDAEHLDIGRPSLGLYPTNKMVMTAKEDREKMKSVIQVEDI